MSLGVYPPSSVMSGPLSIANGGTGATTAAQARTNLGLGTMATQNATAVAITGGTADLAQFAVGTGANITSGYAVVTGAENVYFGGPTTVQDSLNIGGNNNATIRVLAAQTVANGIAFWTDQPSSSNRWAFYGSGTAPSYFGGEMQVQGNIGIRTAPHPNMGIHLNYQSVSKEGIRLTPSNGSTATPIAFVRWDGAAYVGTISTTDTATAYNTTSDVRLKHAIAPLTDALARVRALRPVAFRWNADDSSGVGYLAHELMTVVPEAVTGLPDAVDAEGKIVPQQVDHSKLVPWLTAALQELTARVAALEGTA